MAGADIVERLARHRTLGAAPRHELEWLAAHGTLHRLEAGEALTDPSQPLESLDIVLSGYFALHLDHGLGPRKVMEWNGGDVSGLLPYSRLTKPPGRAVASEPVEMFSIHRDHFPEMIRECPTVTATLVHVMLDRARRFTTSDLQDEKLMSLGKIAAGLAHELNNPASAAVRSARRLREGMSPLEEASRAVGEARLTPSQLAVIDEVRGICDSNPPGGLSTIERADREETISDWLEAHDIDSGAAGSLVDTTLTIAQLEKLAAALDRSALAIVINWLAADCAARALAREVEHAAARMHDLVAAVKRSTHMDRSAAPEPIDLFQSINDSVTMLQHKARRKSVSIAINVEPGTPRAVAVGGELGQIWTNLVDNAIDAAPEASTVEITAAPKGRFIIVRVIDSGPGVPEEFRARIFDPFFTTKPVGEGTGLGLDIALKIARSNGGDMEVESRPGRTEFRVTLPAETRG